MDSTMQDVPLTVTGDHAIRLRRQRRSHRHDRDGRRATARDLPRTRGAGWPAGECVARVSASPVTSASATFMWNNAEHLAAYLAVPSMGAVLHTLNIRLSPEQIAYIANEAEDQVIIADLSLAAQLAPVLPLLETVHTVIAVGDGDLEPADGIRARPCCATTRCWRRSRPHSTGRDIDETVRGGDVLHQRHDGKPERRCLQPSFELSARDEHVHRQRPGDRRSRTRCCPIVPMFHANAWGLPYAALMAGADLVLTDRFLDPKSLIDADRDATAHRGRRRADDLERRHALPGEVAGPRHLVAAAGRRAAGRRCRCR